MMRGAVLLVGVSVWVLCTSTAFAIKSEDPVSWDDLKGFAGGLKDMWRAYRDMQQAEHPGSDKYFRARGNYEAAKRGRGGRGAAEMVSDFKGFYNKLRWNDSEEGRLDAEADEWGRNLNDPNRYRPEGLDPKY